MSWGGEACASGSGTAPGETDQGKGGGPSKKKVAADIYPEKRLRERRGGSFPTLSQDEGERM